MIRNHDFAARHKTEPTAFTRNRKQNFFKVAVVTLSIIVKSLRLTLEDFFESVGEGECSKQAFSKARSKLKPSAYKELFQMSADEVLGANAIGRHRGYRLFAIDGTSLMLPSSKPIREKYKPTSGSHLPHARASFFYDVITGFLMDACFDAIETSERTMAFAHLETLKGKLNDQDIILADRGYPSKEMIACLMAKQLKYVMRLQKSFSAEIDSAQEHDFQWKMSYNGAKNMVRVVKTSREGSEGTIYITNLSKEEWSAAEICELYTKRWAIETRFQDLKVKIEGENFSGKTPNTLEQDFYARLYLMNVEAAMKLEADEIIAANDAIKPPKYPRKTNENILFGLLRKNMPRMLIERDDEKRDEMLNKIIKKVVKNAVQVIPDRLYDRSKRSHKRITQTPKRCL